jgi:hypothetical protein
LVPFFGTFFPQTSFNMPDRPKQPRPGKSGAALRWAVFNRFKDLRKWHTSERGNLHRPWEGKRITIFTRQESFGWCVGANPENPYDEPRFSKRTYDTQIKAIYGAAVALELLTPLSPDGDI